MVSSKSTGIQLKCEDHGSKTRYVFKHLANDDKFTDVTLVSEDGTSFPVHRAIVGFSSPYLYSIFEERNSEKIVEFPVKASFLRSMLEYIYLGETRVEVTVMKEFLDVANRFQIQGIWLDEDTKDETEPKIYRPKQETNLSDKLKHCCNICVLQFETKNDLRNHRSTKHQKVAEKIQCEECGYIGTKNALNQHKLLHSGVMLSCNICEYSTVKSIHLKEHVKNVHKPVYIFCDKCSFRAKTTRYLKGHNEREHEGKIYMCDKCEYKTKFSERFVDHTNGVHEGVKYNCDQCDYTSTFRAPMLNHKKIKHSDIRYPCKYCTYIATRSYNLRSHERKSHSTHEALPFARQLL